jgi:hypothetical protein
MTKPESKPKAAARSTSRSTRKSGSRAHVMARWPIQFSRPSAAKKIATRPQSGIIIQNSSTLTYALISELETKADARPFISKH